MLLCEFGADMKIMSFALCAGAGVRLVHSVGYQLVAQSLGYQYRTTTQVEMNNVITIASACANTLV